MLDYLLGFIVEDMEGNLLLPTSYSFTTAMMVRGPNKRLGR